MMRLFGVELRRLRARTAIVMLVAIGLGSTLLFAWAAYQSARPMSEAQLAEAEQMWEQQQRDWEENGEQYVEDCLEAQATESELVGEEVDYGCDQMAPQREWFFWEPPTFAEYVPGALGAGLLVVAMLSLLAGITFVAAEFGTGSIGTWLTFEPRRGRVFLSKVAAAAVGGAVFGVVWAWAFLGAIAAGYLLAGSEPSLTTALVHATLRIGVLGAGVALLGAALGFLVRHTAAALGVAIGYLIAIDTIALGRGGGARWSLMTNVTAWGAGRASYYVTECTVEADGTFCEGVERTVTMTQGGLVTLGVVVLVTALGLLAFRRRDV